MMHCPQLQGGRHQKSQLEASSSLLLGLLFHPEDGGRTFFRNFYKLQPEYTAGNNTFHGDR
jgi:hypothetical protein